MIAFFNERAPVSLRSYIVKGQKHDYPRDCIQPYPGPRLLQTVRVAHLRCNRQNMTSLVCHCTDSHVAYGMICPHFPESIFQFKNRLQNWHFPIFGATSFLFHSIVPNDKLHLQNYLKIRLKIDRLELNWVSPKDYLLRYFLQGWKIDIIFGKIRTKKYDPSPMCCRWKKFSHILQVWVVERGRRGLRKIDQGFHIR